MQCASFPRSQIVICSSLLRRLHLPRHLCLRHGRCHPQHPPHGAPWQRCKLNIHHNIFYNIHHMCSKDLSSISTISISFRARQLDFWTFLSLIIVVDEYISMRWEVLHWYIIVGPTPRGLLLHPQPLSQALCTDRISNLFLLLSFLIFRLFNFPTHNFLLSISSCSTFSSSTNIILKLSCL